MKVKELKKILENINENLEVCSEIEEGFALSINETLLFNNAILLFHRPPEGWLEEGRQIEF